MNYSRGMAFSYNAFSSLNTSVINIATGAQDVNVALGNETCIGINQPATFIGGQPFQLPIAQCLYVPSVRKDISIDPDTGRVRLGWTSGIRVMHGDDYQPIPIQLTMRYFDPSGFEWIIAREAVVISAPYQAHTWFLGNTASLPAGFRWLGDHYLDEPSRLRHRHRDRLRATQRRAWPASCRPRWRLEPGQRGRVHQLAVRGSG